MAAEHDSVVLEPTVEDARPSTRLECGELGAT
jgi:hypothetical protein